MISLRINACATFQMLFTSTTFFALVFAFTAAFSLLALNAHSQISTGGTPRGFKEKVRDYNLQTLQVQAPEIYQLLKEDEEAGKWGVAERIGLLLPVNVRLVEHGVWLLLADGSRQWRLRISSQDALGLSLYFEDFYLPLGCDLFIYSDSRTKLIGAFTHANNHESGLFATEIIPGESLIIELIIAPQVSEQPRFIITDVLYAYRNQREELKQFGKSGPCNVNVNCSEGFQWKNQKRGVVKINSRVGGSVFRCSGSLVNNTNYDFLPYIYTADHCARSGSLYASEADMNQWIFYFNYEAGDCPNPPDEPIPVSLTGAALKANVGSGSVYMASDFCLMLLNNTIPPYVMPFYNGWSWVNTPSPNGVGIHHPSGDIKKISTYLNPLISTHWPTDPINTANMYWRVQWSPTPNGHGVTEGGSSGSPLFNNEGLIVGQLTGGQASCNNLNAPDFYGKFAVSWESIGAAPERQLKYWLDPGDTGLETLKGSFNNTQVVSFFSADTTTIQIGGRVGFNDVSINDPLEWHWKFKGGDPAESFEQNPGPVTYKSFGHYDVTLIAKNEISADTLIRKNYINVVPTLFPNPATEQITMLLGDHGEDTMKVEVSDIMGRPVANWIFYISGLYSVKMKTAGLGNGVYILNFYTEDYSFRRQKLIIAR